MSTTTIGRSLAIVASAAMLASLTVATVAAPASAAKPKCAGKTATIVGTARSETIRGTAKADVIVAKGGNDVVYGRGGNDTICGGGGNDRILGAGGKDVLLGQGGRDKLYGGAGRDRLLGGPANDRLAGGPGNDACLQGSGVGLRLSCERPVAPLPPAPTPTPTPTPTPVPKTLVIAYSDLNGNHTFDTGDVMISKMVDTNGDGVPSVGDTIKMGRYPTNTNPGSADFADWDVKSHVVEFIDVEDATEVEVDTIKFGVHTWIRTTDTTVDEYTELSFDGISKFLDDEGTNDDDTVVTNALSPSKPALTVNTTIPGTTDDRFLDVDFLY